MEAVHAWVCITDKECPAETAHVIYNGLYANLLSAKEGELSLSSKAACYTNIHEKIAWNRAISASI